VSKRKNRNHSSAFKKQVVLAALRQNKTIAEICQEFNLYESQISQWKSQALEHLEEAFKKGNARNALQSHEKEMAQLHQKIGELLMERDSLETIWSRYRGTKRGKA